MRSPNQNPRSTLDHYCEATHRAITYLEEHAVERIRLDDIARPALLSKYHFHRDVFTYGFVDLDATMERYLENLKAELDRCFQGSDQVL